MSNNNNLIGNALPVFFSNLTLISLAFTFFMSFLSILFTINHTFILKSNVITSILELRVIQNYTAFCVICSRYLFSIGKTFFIIYVLLDASIVLSFILARINSLRTSYSLFTILFLLLTLIATLALFFRIIVRFGAYVDINQAIDFTKNPEPFIYIATKVFKQTINNIPPINHNNTKYISYMNGAMLGVAVTGTVFTGYVYYETHKTRKVAEASLKVAEASLKEAQRTTDLSALYQNVIDKETYFERHPGDRPKK